MAVYPKAMESTGSATGAGGANVTTSYQPASGKLWWFHAMRYAARIAAPVSTTAQLIVERYISASSQAITEKLVEATSATTVSDAGEVKTGCAATNSNYLRVTRNDINGASYRWAITWFGVEVDV